MILKVLPDWILAIMLIVLLAATANRTLRKGIKSYNKETVAQQVQQAPYACTYLDRSVRSLEKSGSLKTPVFKFVQVSPKSSHDDGKTRACADTFRTCTCTSAYYSPPVCYTDK